MYQHPCTASYILYRITQYRESQVSITQSLMQSGPKTLPKAGDGKGHSTPFLDLICDGKP